VLDLTSSLYLGLVHPSSQLPGWPAMTAGVPAALGEAPPAAEVARRLCRLIGTAAARLATSTLHGFIDLAGTLGGERSPLQLGVDVAAYPIGRLGLSPLLEGAGAYPARLPHFEPEAAGRWAGRIRSRGRTPVLLVDGLCGGCGCAAPLADLAAALGPFDGVLLVDDTQGLGLLGTDPAEGDPWGHGGGGALRHAGGPRGVIVVASLAKAFGAPLAVVAGPKAFVESSRRRGPTFAHSSPPSVPALQAARRALEINEQQGDLLRRRLQTGVRTLRGALQREGFTIDSGSFPVVRVAASDTAEALEMAQRLAHNGIKAVPLAGSCRRRPALGMAVTVAVAPSQLRFAADALARCGRRSA
jgi:8-amino-7-oxononanoate synthase